MDNNNEISKLRNATGLNRKEFSELTQIPYMTLTDWELGKHDAPAYVYRLLEYYVRLNNILDVSELWKKDKCHVWEEQKNYRSVFPIVHHSPIVPVQYIYPTKQEIAIELNAQLCKFSDVVSVIMFGSSVSQRCNKSSDTDLSIRLLPDSSSREVKNNVSDIVQEICNYKADIIWYDSLKAGSRLYKNIMKGVQIV